MAVPEGLTRRTPRQASATSGVPEGLTRRGGQTEAGDFRQRLQAADPSQARELYSEYQRTRRAREREERAQIEQRTREISGLPEVQGVLMMGLDPSMGESSERFQIPNQGGLTMDFLTTLDPAERIQAVRNRVPDAEFEQVGEAVVVTVPRPISNQRGVVDEPIQFVMNTPGFSAGDVFDFVTTGAQYLPASRVASGGKTLLTRSGLASITEGATTAAREIAGQIRGVGDISLGNIAIDAALGGLSEPVLQGVRSMLRRGMRRVGVDAGARQFTPEGGLSQDALNQLDEAGISQNQIVEMIEQIDEGDLAPEQIPEMLERMLLEAEEELLDPQLADGLTQAERAERARRASAAAARRAEAAEEGVDLTLGEASQESTIQSAEYGLRRPTVTTTAGEAARQQKVQQASQLDQYAQRVLGGMDEGLEGMSETQRGKLFQDVTVEELARREQIVRDAYRALDDFGDDLPSMDIDQLRQFYLETVSGSGVEQNIRDGIEEILARYGVLGDVRTVDGVPVTRGTGVEIDFNGRTITVPDGVTPLTVQNSENMRRELNGLFDRDFSGVSQAVKHRMDELIMDALDSASPQARETQEAIVTARDTFRELQDDFYANDILRRVTERVRGRDVLAMDAEEVLSQLNLRTSDRAKTGRANLADLRRLVEVLGGENSTAESRRALPILRHAVLSDILEAANINRTDEAAPVVLNGRLFNKALSQFGNERFDVLFPGQWGDDVRKLQRILRNATVPMPDVVPTGSAPETNRVYDLMARLSRRLPDSSGTIPYAERHLEGLAAAKAQQETLRGIQEGAPSMMRSLDSRNRGLLQLWLSVAPTSREAATVEEATKEDIERANR